ncbi:putative alpha/Beta hydrolase [Helianthus debilis subsp. tardiflorus]
MSPTLIKTKKRAAGALFAVALNQVQIHQTRPVGSAIASDSFSNDRRLWLHDSSALLRPIFRYLEIDSAHWPDLETTATSSHVKNHVGSFLRVLAEENDESSTKLEEQELALSKAVEAMESNISTSREYYERKKEKHHVYAHEWREKFLGNESMAETKKHLKQTEEKDCKSPHPEQAPAASTCEVEEKTFEEAKMIGNRRKVAVLYELLSACLADTPGDDNNSKRSLEGYDARHRSALRLLTTWFDIKWIKMEAIEVLISCSAMAVLKQGDGKENENASDDSWEKWKRGGLIGAAAITGGTLMAITGGLAAPAIASGVGALAPTLGTVVPVIGAGGFAAVASAAGSVAGSVAVAASFGAAGAGLSGAKMARRTGSVDEFEFKAIGENHNQGRLAVEIMVAGFVFEEADFVRPWEGENDNMERYALQWESKHLIAVSTAIQDWLTSRIAMEMMKQGAMMTVLSSLLTALALPAALLTLTDIIDSKWSIAVDRSDKAGKLLAEVLVNGLQGNRPVTLVGFSLGARVIFKCLENLAESGHVGIVERVVLLGAPVAIKDEKWEAVRKVVSGRLINAYSTNDWTLGVAFRASLLSQGLAGIEPVDVPGIENVDVTEVIEGHSSYLWGTREILDRLDLDAYYPVFKVTHTKSPDTA